MFLPALRSIRRLRPRRIPPPPRYPPGVQVAVPNPAPRFWTVRRRCRAPPARTSPRLRDRCRSATETCPHRSERRQSHVSAIHSARMCDGVPAGIADTDLAYAGQSTVARVMLHASTTPTAVDVTCRNGSRCRRIGLASSVEIWFRSIAAGRSRCRAENQRAGDMWPPLVLPPSVCCQRNT